jgi:signal transduction histidine kinase/CheY-like chemotaxis protein/5-carboxymethyl-2-hydroxymuconate isomerase
MASRHRKRVINPTEYAWHLLSDEDILAERRRLLDRQRRFMEIAAAINASGDPDHVLRLVRDAVVDSGLFDRAGVWVMEGDHFRGAWGTDTEGNPRDERHLREAATDWGPLIPLLVTGETPYVIKSWRPVDEDGRIVTTEVAHAVVALRAGTELLGVLSVDNLLTSRPVLKEDVESLLPFADMASAAIHSARTMRERDRLMERQRRLMQLATSMNASIDLPQILRLVHDAVIETAGFDRAAVFMIDPLKTEVQGAWGTSREGKAVDGSHWVSRRDSDHHDSLLWKVVDEGTPYYLTHDYTQELCLAEGHSMYGVRSHATVTMRSSGEIVGVICVDNLLTDRHITETEVQGLLPFAEQAALAIHNARLFQELHIAQEALLRSEKLRALGELAGGVAHNINNLLTAVLGYAELIRQHPESPDNVRRYAGIIERAGMDGAEIVRRVQQFAQQQATSKLERIDLSALVREAVELSRPYWKDRADACHATISLKLEVGRGFTVSGVASELREVVVNLLRNAADAMPAGGKITVRCRASGPEAFLEVTDTGLGMDEATRKRVFEPFFTTKGPALGLGLGLSMAWGIIVRHGGTIFVESKPGRGARFRVALPLAEPKVAEPPEEKPAMSLAGKRILLVDDETYVLESLSQLLEHCEATVFSAQGGEEALAWLAANPSGCDIVLTDFGMPGMTGLDLLTAVHERHPALFRALISGWGTASPSDTGMSPAQVVLNKPITRDTLVRALSDFPSTNGSQAAA